MSLLHGDPWLEPWLPLIAQRAGADPILELGCGTGRDTAILTRAGHKVVAIDLSAVAIAAAKLRVRGASFLCQDILDPFPVAEGSVGVVIASLSLHYFEWQQTLDLVARIRRSLRADGVLLCRLNSTRDENFGASGHERIADNYYRVDGQPKRFFDRTAVDTLFAGGWHLLGVREDMIDRYLAPKAAWEIVAAPSAPGRAENAPAPVSIAS